jgi:hypothetical protein
VEPYYNKTHCCLADGLVSYLILPAFQDGCKVTEEENGSEQITHTQNGEGILSFYIAFS